MRAGKASRDAKPAVLNLGDLLRFDGGKPFRFPGCQEHSDQLLSSTDARGFHRMRSGGHCGCYNAQRTCRLRYRDVWTSERPAAAESHVQTQAEFARFASRKAQVIHEFVGEIGKVAETVRRVVEFERVHGLNFDPADAPFFHFAEFPSEFRLRYRRSEPPRAHQNSAIVRRLDKSPPQPLQLSHGRWRLRSSRSKENYNRREQCE